MPERRSTPNMKTFGMSERSSTPSYKRRSVSEPMYWTPLNRNQNFRQFSLNARLGANGPADTNSPNSEDKTPKRDRILEDISAQLPNLSINSSPEHLLRKSLNERLSKVRNAVNQRTDSNGSSKLNKSVISNGLEPPQQDSVNQSFNEINSCCIKVDFPTGTYHPHGLNESLVSSETVSADFNKSCVSATNGVSVTDEMSKRDFLGNEKIESNLSKNLSSRKCTVAGDVIKEEPAFKVVEGNKDTLTTKPKDAQGKFNSRHSDIYQPKRSEPPECSAPKISRHDFPSSFGTKGRKSNYYDADIIEEVEKYFDKRFYLSSETNWELPEPSQLFSSEPWEIKELIECKDKLNAVKKKLDDLELKKWHDHTKKRNRAGQIIWKLRKVVKPEFPTQAWCKFYENLCTFKLIPKKAKQDKMLNSVHLCEAPGAFITALNHYIRTNAEDSFKWNWLGTTLNPHYEGNPLSLMINEDRFILHTMEHWTFGEDQTGDLMNPHNVEDLKKQAEEMGEVLLVTADGSINCQDDPGEQENVVAWLHFCEALSAMSILAEGGNFLVKIFTMFEHMTVCLLYLLSCVFEEVIVNKPATSKEGNSETYVVCLNYVGKSKIEPWLSALFINYGPNRPRKALFPKESIPEEFLEAVVECAETFRQFQTDVIEANLESFKNPDDLEKSRNEQIRRAVTDEFFRRYRLKELPEEFDIVGRKIINKMETYNMDPRLETGSFSDKLKRKEVSERQKILDLKEDLERLERQVLEKWPADEKIWWYEFDSNVEYQLSKEIKISTGKPVKRINSSKFCLGCLLDIRNQVRDIVLNSKSCNLPSFNTSTDQLISVPHQTSVLDFKNTLWSSSDAGLNAEEELRAFKTIIEEFDKLSRDDNLVIYGYPLLTQFNVGLVYLLAHSFQRMGITQPRGQNFAIIFEKHDISSKKIDVKEKLDEISDNIQPTGRTVLAMLPIQNLCGGPFYKYVTMANNICVKEQVMELIQGYLSATKSKADREKRRWTTF